MNENPQMQLVVPAEQYLPGYADALRKGWSPDNLRPARAREELDEIADDPERFIAEHVDRGTHRDVVLPDGRRAPRLPSIHKWMWDGEFCGAINLRWQHGTADLPPYCLGHIGFSVVPWKRRLGFATRALALILPDANALGLPYAELTTDADNVASQRVIRANGGMLVEHFNTPESYGGTPSLRFRIPLPDNRPEA